MLTLLLSLAAIGVAPLLDRPLARSQATSSGADAFAAVAVLGTVLLHVLPHGIEAQGAWALLAAAAGLALPSICDLGGIRILGLAAVAGLGAHALVDGAMLAAPDEDAAGRALSWAVVIHTVPLSLAIWRAARPSGLPLAAGLLGLTVVSELIGWTGARALLDVGAGFLGLLQCFTAGTLLHFVWAPAPASRRGSGVGALLGGAAIVAMNLSWPLHRLQAGELDAGATLLGLALAMAPLLLAGALLAAVSRALSPRREVSPEGDPTAGWSGTLGLLASVAPLGASILVLRGVFSTLAPALARALAGPLPADGPRDERRGITRLATGFLPRLRELGDATTGHLLLGLGLASVVEPLVPVDAFGRLPAALTIPAAVLLGPLLGLGPVGITPVAAVLLHKGLDPGAAMALLLAGSALSRAGLERMIALLGRLRALRVAGALLALSALGGLVGRSMADALHPPPLHVVIGDAASPLSWGALVALGILGVDTVLRGGLPALMGPLARPHEHGHDHGHDHGHVHERG